MANPVRRAYKSVRFERFVTVLPLRWPLDVINAKGLLIYLFILLFFCQKNWLNYAHWDACFS